MARFIDNKTRTQALLPEFPRLTVSEKTLEELVTEEIGGVTKPPKKIVQGALHYFCGADVDHRRFQLLDQSGQ
jgi:hypothetical protein